MTISFRGETAGSVGKINLNPRRKETAGSIGNRNLGTKTPQEEASIFSILRKNDNFSCKI